MVLLPKPDVENSPDEGTVLQWGLALEKLVKHVLLVEEGAYVEMATLVVVGTGVYAEVGIASNSRNHRGRRSRHLYYTLI